MTASLEPFVLDALSRAGLNGEPFPHLYVEGLFPPDYYRELLCRLPPRESFICHADSGKVSKGAYKERFSLPLDARGLGRIAEGDRPFFAALAQLAAGPALLLALIRKFRPYITARFEMEAQFEGKVSGIEVATDAMLVRDTVNYALGPHTDARHRLLSVLVYLPDDDRHPELGTAFYTPNDPAFRCPGGPHHPFASFQRVGLAPYRANSALAFLKTDNSFHGVEPVPDRSLERRLLMIEVKIRGLQLSRPPRTEPSRSPVPSAA
ncbi:MAG TPA: hypothetical protein VJN41_01935 [Alphaproteobacteria bacterium]|nr:hypothetical protein [Alphaproteobacteria bacterium]